MMFLTTFISLLCLVQANDQYCPGLDTICVPSSVSHFLYKGHTVTGNETYITHAGLQVESVESYEKWISEHPSGVTVIGDSRSDPALVVADGRPLDIPENLSKYRMAKSGYGSIAGLSYAMGETDLSHHLLFYEGVNFYRGFWPLDEQKYYSISIEFAKQFYILFIHLTQLYGHVSNLETIEGLNQCSGTAMFGWVGNHDVGDLKALWPGSPCGKWRMVSQVGNFEIIDTATASITRRYYCFTSPRDIDVAVSFYRSFAWSKTVQPPYVHSNNCCGDDEIIPNFVEPGTAGAQLCHNGYDSVGSEMKLIADKMWTAQQEVAKLNNHWFAFDLETDTPGYYPTLNIFGAGHGAQSIIDYFTARLTKGNGTSIEGPDCRPLALTRISTISSTHCGPVGGSSLAKPLVHEPFHKVSCETDRKKRSVLGCFIPFMCIGEGLLSIFGGGGGSKRNADAIKKLSDEVQQNNADIRENRQDLNRLTKEMQSFQTAINSDLEAIDEKLVEISTSYNKLLAIQEWERAQIHNNWINGVINDANVREINTYESEAMGSAAIYFGHDNYVWKDGCAISDSPGITFPPTLDTHTVIKPVTVDFQTDPNAVQTVLPVTGGYDTETIPWWIWLIVALAISVVLGIIAFMIYMFVIKPNKTFVETGMTLANM